VVVKSVPANSVVVGVPGQIVQRSHPHHMGDVPDLNHTSLPDVLGLSLQQLLERVDALETRLDGHAIATAHVHAPHGASWAGDDFSI
jgi:serine O-acetyltransferase